MVCLGGRPNYLNVMLIRTCWETEFSDYILFRSNMYKDWMLNAQNSILGARLGITTTGGNLVILCIYKNLMKSVDLITVDGHYCKYKPSILTCIYP